MHSAREKPIYREPYFTMSAELKAVWRCAAHTYEDADRGIPKPEESDSSAARCKPLSCPITAPVVNIRFTIHALSNSGSRALVVAFRGSIVSPHMENWVGNAMVLMARFPESWSGSKVHSGNYRAWDLFLKPRVQHELRGLSSADFDRIIFTGHSLGGAIATLAAADLVSDTKHWGCEVLASRPAVSVFTFGQPHSGNANFKQGYLQNKILHKRYINATDPVPMALAAVTRVAEGAGVEADKYVHVSEEIFLAGGLIGKVVEVGEQVNDVGNAFKADGFTKKALRNALGSHRHSLGAYNKAIENHGQSTATLLAKKGVGLASSAVSSALVKRTMGKGAPEALQGATQMTKSAGGVAGALVTALPLVNVGLGVANLAVGVHNGYHICKMRGEVREVSTKIDAIRGEMDAGFSEMNTNMDAGFSEMNTNMDAGFSKMNTNMDAGFSKMNTNMDAGFSEMNTNMDAGFSEMNTNMDAGFSEMNVNINSLGDFLGGELAALEDVLELQTYQLEVLTDDSRKHHLRTHEMLHALARRMDTGFEDTKREIATQFTKHEMYQHWNDLSKLETAVVERFKEVSSEQSISNLQKLKDAASKLMDEVKHQFKKNKHLGTDGDPRRVHLVAHFVFAARTERDALLFESPGSPSAAPVTASSDTNSDSSPQSADGSTKTLASWLQHALGTNKYTDSLEAEVETLQMLLAADPDEDLPEIFDAVKMPKLARKALLKALKETKAQAASSPPAAPPAPTQHSTKHLDEALRYICDEVHGICEKCEFNLFKLATDYSPYLQQYLELALGIKEGLELDKMGWDNSDAQAGDGKQEEEEEVEEADVATLLAKYEDQGALQLRQERTRSTFQKAATFFYVGNDALIEQMASDATLAKLHTAHSYTLVETVYPCMHLDLYSELVDLFGEMNAEKWARFKSQQTSAAGLSDVVQEYACANAIRFVMSFLARYPMAIRKVRDREALDLIVQAATCDCTQPEIVVDQSVLLRRLMHADGRDRIMECIVHAASAGKKVLMESMGLLAYVDSDAQQTVTDIILQLAEGDTSLDLSSVKMGIAGAVAITPMLRISSVLETICLKAITMKVDITEADLSGKELGASGAIIVAAFLPKCQALETITFGDEQAVTMKANMTEANFSSKRLGVYGAMIVAAFIPKCQALASVNILSNGIGAEQANELIKIMESKPNLKTLCGFSGDETELDLSKRGLTTGCAVLVAHEVKNNGALVTVTINKFALPIQHIRTRAELDLSGKSLGVEDAIIIAALIPLNGALTIITFGDKRAVTAEELVAEQNEAEFDAM
eukprot:g868.t1